MNNVLRLQALRQALYDEFGPACDALFDLCDAVLTTPAAPSFAHLSLSPLFRRQWPSLYEALEDARPDPAVLMRLSLACLEEAAFSHTRSRPLLVGDHTTWPRLSSPTLEDRSYEHHGDRQTRIQEGVPITIGYGFSTMALVPEAQGSWVLPLLHERISYRFSKQSALEKAAAALRAVAQALQARSQARPLALFDSQYGCASSARAGFGHLALSFSDPEAGGYRPVVDRDYDAAVQEAVADVLARFDTNRAGWAEVTGADDWAVARQHAQVLHRWVEANADGGRRYGAVRDSSMAENVRWIREREGPDAKVIVWAHNTHIANWETPESWGGHPMLGHHLRTRYGSDVVIVGALFGQGGFTALEVGASSRGLWPFTVGPPPEGTVESAFAAAGLDLALVDLRRLPAAGPVAAWFRTPQPTRNSGGVYDVDNPKRHLLPYVAAEAFDALMYVDTTTPTRPVEPADYGAFPVLAAPVNLGFEHGVLSEAPPGWLAWSKLRRFGFTVATTDERRFHGSRAAVVRRDVADEIGEASGSVLQRIDASAYRGRRVRVRAAARADLADGGLAFFRLRVHAPEYVDHDPADNFYDSLDEHRVASDEWRVYEIVADVPENAEMISYGLYLAGSGAAWLDAVTVEAVDE